LFSRIVNLTVHSSQSNDPKIKIQKQKSHGLPTLFHLFSYINREMRDRERKKKERRDQIEQIKIEIRPSQVQTVITFDRKLRLRRVTRSRKAYDEIYKVNLHRCYRHFQDKKTSS
jgi:hypothetical protein